MATGWPKSKPDHMYPTPFQPDLDRFIICNSKPSQFHELILHLNLMPCCLLPVVLQIKSPAHEVSYIKNNHNWGSARPRQPKLEHVPTQ